MSQGVSGRLGAFLMFWSGTIVGGWSGGVGGEGAKQLWSLGKGWGLWPSTFALEAEDMRLLLRDTTPRQRTRHPRGGSCDFHIGVCLLWCGVARANPGRRR